MPTMISAAALLQRCAVKFLLQIPLEICPRIVLLRENDWCSWPPCMWGSPTVGRIAISIPLAANQPYIHTGPTRIVHPGDLRPIF